jgi:hypothetical protein
LHQEDVFAAHILVHFYRHLAIAEATHIDIAKAKVKLLRNTLCQRLVGAPRKQHEISHSRSPQGLSEYKVYWKLCIFRSAETHSTSL